MMKFVKKFVLGSVFLVAANSALASVAELSVTGTVLPPSCTPSFVGGGLADYGSSALGALSATEFVRLPIHSSSFSIDCGAPLAIAYRLIDGRASSNFSPFVGTYGLGQQRDVNIGTIIVRHAGGHMADGAATQQITSVDGVTWTLTGDGLPIGRNELVSYRRVGGVAPEAFSRYTGVLGLQPMIGPTERFDTDEEVTMDGLITMEVVYL